MQMLEEGVWAEIKVGGEHLRLFSEHNAQGVQVSVYDVNAQKWIAPSEAIDDIEQGKEKAIEYAKLHLAHTVNAELPPLVWKESRSA
jgi:hypothetical protein